MRAPIQSILFLSLFAFACSDPAATPATDAGTDAKPPKDGGADATPPPDIKGTTALSVTVVSNVWSNPQTDNDPGVAVSGAAVRVENGAGGSLEGVTDSSGKATIMVDIAKGPFDVTVAKAAMGATSILEVKTAADLTKVIWLPQPLPRQEFSIGGAINGKKAATNEVVIDAPWFQTVFAKANAATYTTKHVYVTDDVSPVTIAAIEVDPATKLAVNAVMMPGVTRTKSAMTADITLPSVAVTPTVTNVQVNLPTTGLLTAADITTVGQTGFPAYNNSVVQKTSGKSATYVGLGLISKPVGNTANFKITAFGGDLAPTSAYAFLNNGNGLGFSVGTVDFTTAITVPPITKLGADGTSLGDATLEVDSAGYDYVSGSVFDNDPAVLATIWDVYVTGKTLAKHPFPHLPSTVSLTSITSASDLILGMTMVKAAKAPKDYSGVFGTQAFVNASSSVQVSAAF